MIQSWSLLYFSSPESTETRTRQKPKRFCMKILKALSLNVRSHETLHTPSAIRYISITMTSSRCGRARQFLHALAAVLLVTCSFTSQASTDVSEAHAIASIAIDVNPDEVNGSLQENSPQELLRRGTMLLQEEGDSKEGVRVLEEAVTLWKKEVRIQKSAREGTTPQQLPKSKLHIWRDYYLHIRPSSGYHGRPRTSTPNYNGSSTSAVLDSMLLLCHQRA